MAYSSDITDQGWEKIKDLFPNGNRSVHDKRILVNAVFLYNENRLSVAIFAKRFSILEQCSLFFLSSKEKRSLEENHGFSGS